MFKKAILWNLLIIYVKSPSLTMPIVKSLFIVTKPTQFFVCCTLENSPETRQP